MNFARVWYQRFQQLVHEVAKFGVIGALGFVVTDGGSNLLHFQLGQGPLKSNIIATVVATLVTYLGNRYWTFRHRQGSTMRREYVLFFALNAVGLGIQLACLDFTVYVLGLDSKLPYNIALVFGIGLGTLFRFWSYRRWVWTAPSAPAQAVSERPAPAPTRREPQPTGGLGQTWHVSANGRAGVNGHGAVNSRAGGDGWAGDEAWAGGDAWAPGPAQAPVRVNGRGLREHTPEPESLEG